MSIPLPIRSALLVCLPLLGLLGSGCTKLKELDAPFGQRVRTTIENTWSPKSKAIARMDYAGGWKYSSATEGESVVVRLYRHIYLIGTYDGLSYREIAFQLPADAAAGDTYKLRPVPADRPMRRIEQYDARSYMRDGEITAFQYGNPRSGLMEQLEEATVTIKSISKNRVVIHLRLVADLEPRFDFDVDEEFTLEVR